MNSKLRIPLCWKGVFGLSARWVRDVMVAGEWAVLDRQLARADQRELAAAARGAAARLWHRLEELPAHPYTHLDLQEGRLQWL